MACQKSSNNTEVTIESETYTSNDASLTNTNEELYSTVSDDIDNAIIKLPLAEVEIDIQKNTTITDNVDEIYDDAVSPKIDDTNHEDNTSASKNTNNSQSNTDANEKTNGAKQTCNTNISKSCVFVLIVAMVVIGIGSSAITVLILKQEFRIDLRSIQDEIESLNLKSNNDSESSWSSWSDWDDCSVTCNVGVRTRNRSCDTFDINTSRGTCSGNDVDMSTCNNGFCLESSWSTWSDWGDCSVTCNVGVRTRNRSCDTSDIDRSRGTCVGNDVDISTCNNALCQAHLNELQQLIQFEGSSTYVRWGSGSCPGNGTDLVYWGYVGGSHYSHSGGAANYICLPQDPDWGHYEDALQHGGFVYGAEYEYSHRTSSSNFFELHATSIQNNDAIIVSMLATAYSFGILINTNVFRASCVIETACRKVAIVLFGPSGMTSILARNH